MSLSIATWNVNSLKVRLPQLLAWLAKRTPDVVALQETKLIDDAFPYDELAAAGYASTASGQKTYNGVAVLTRVPLAAAAGDVATSIPGFVDEQKRVLAVTVGDVRVVNLYVPNGQAVGSDKFRYKLEWFGALAAWLKDELTRHPRLVVLGDFNIAPEDRDVHDPDLWRGKIHFSEPEHEALRSIVALGLADTFRLFEQPERQWSWWDYRTFGFERGEGLRIDLLYASPALAALCRECIIDSEQRGLERPSDHAPVIARFDT